MKNDAKSTKQDRKKVTPTRVRYSPGKKIPEKGKKTKVVFIHKGERKDATTQTDDFEITGCLLFCSENQLATTGMSFNKHAKLLQRMEDPNGKTEYGWPMYPTDFLQAVADPEYFDDLDKYEPDNWIREILDEDL